MNRIMSFIKLPLVLSVLTFITIGLSAQKTRSVEKCHQFLRNVTVNCLLTDDFDMLWVGTDMGFYIFNSYEGVRTLHEEGAVTAIAFDGNSAWSALSSGRVLNTDKTREISLENGTTITSMVVKGRDLWIGTKKKGVFVYDAESLEQKSHFRKSNSELRSDEINFIHKDMGNALWIGSSLGVCHVLNNTWKLYKGNESITALEEKDGEIWLMSNRGLWKVDQERKWKNMVLRRGARKGRVNNMFFDETDRLYIASDVFTRYNLDTKSVTSYNKKKGYTNDKTLCIGIDQSGDVWAGTAQKGLFRFKVIQEIFEDSSAVFTLNNLFFEDDSYELTYNTKMELNKLIGYLKQNNSATIDIIGYTNGLPDNEYCNWLSTWRARKVFEYMSAYGISKTRMEYSGNGKGNPLVSDEPKERNKNQRVEIKVTESDDLAEH